MPVTDFFRDNAAALTVVGTPLGGLVGYYARGVVDDKRDERKAKRDREYKHDDARREREREHLTKLRAQMHAADKDRQRYLFAIRQHLSSLPLAVSDQSPELTLFEFTSIESFDADPLLEFYVQARLATDTILDKASGYWADALSTTYMLGALKPGDTAATKLAEANDAAARVTRSLIQADGAIVDRLKELDRLD